MRQYVAHKTLWKLFAGAVITFLVLQAYLNNVFFYYFNPEKSILCYRLDDEPRLPDISTAVVRKGRSIFFHETSCRSHRIGKIVILPRQACAVESAAKMNPNMDVYLTFSSPGIFKFEGSESDRILQRLLEYKNLKIFHLNYENYTRKTPLERLYQSGQIEVSRYAQSHASDVLRYLTLYKYGGIYLDMDVVVIKPLEGLKPNYAGIETERNVAAGVLSFDHQGVGHKHAESCVMDLKDNYKANGWGDNGPGVITRLLRKLCGVQLAKDMLDKDCGGFTVHPNHSFYPIQWESWHLYFDPSKLGEVLKLCKDSHVLHVWNKHSEDVKIPRDTVTPYTYFAERYCPKVFKECDREF